MSGMTDTILESGQGFVIALSDIAVSAVPYRAEDRDDGQRNHGFIDIVDHPELAVSIPEAQKSPGLLSLLKAINAQDSAFFSIGCECGMFSRDAKENEPDRYVGSYIAIAYRQPEYNKPERLKELAIEILERFGPIEHIVNFEMIIEPLKSFFGKEGIYELNIRIFSYGKSDEEAWTGFDAAGKRAAVVFYEINSLPDSHPLFEQSAENR
jgi:hypothetical protein